MPNERITEDMFEAHLRDLGYFSDSRIIVEKQQSEVKAISDALKKASKRGSGKNGFPEFIIQSLDAPDTVVVVEAKATTSKHESPLRDKPADFAVDGVLHYARFLSPKMTVIAIAVSGSPTRNRWSVFLVPKGCDTEQPLVARTGTKVDTVLAMSDLLDAAAHDPRVQHQREVDLIAFSQEMHVFMRDEAELEEKEKPLAVAGSLLALSDRVFAKTYAEYPARDLPGFWMETIKKVIDDAELPVGKQKMMTQPFTSIEVHPELGKQTKRYPKGMLHEIISMLAEQVMPYFSIYHEFDVVGQFYGEFLKYTGGDGKGLGIVLTPRHITELFAMIANVTTDDVVLDPCAGTGGFLISALKRAALSTPSEKALTDFKRNGLIGVEQQATMYALAASNMILRGDGKAHLHQGSCFDEAIKDGVANKMPNIGMMNPPYAKTKADLSELSFIENMLDMLRVGGTGIAIVPVSCATGGGRHSLLDRHTLEAVMSMPPEVFYPVAAPPVIMVFTAHRPHAQTNRKTWFGYWRDDGFVKVKNKGRIDRDGAWAEIRDRWVEAFRNREIHAGESVMARVTADDEWLAEAYIETDYSTVEARSFDRVLREYASFRIRNSESTGGAQVALPPIEHWRDFPLSLLFDLQKGKRVKSEDRSPGATRFIGASELNNGVTDFADLPPQGFAGSLTVPYNGNSVGMAFYQDEPFFACDDVNILVPKQYLSPWAALFVTAMIRHERFRFTYGYKWTLERMSTSTIRLPARHGDPDWDLMESYMRSLPYSANVETLVDGAE